jgi:hypothetical protein
MPGGQPAGPSTFLADIGKGRIFGSKVAVLERFDGTSWHAVARYRTAHDASAALDAAIGDGAEPGTLRVIDASPSALSRFLMYVGVLLLAVAAILIVLFFVAG